MLQWLEALGVPRWLIERFLGTHRKAVRSAATGLVPAMLSALLYLAVDPPTGRSCHTNATAEPGRAELADAITLGPKSHVSFQRTTGTLLVHILKGDALFRYPESEATSVVVTAGNAQISHIEAVVCVEVGKERTVVEVLTGTAVFIPLRGGNPERSVGELALRTGDRLEVRNGTGEVELRYVVGGACGVGWVGGALP